jgi:branched-chain amino acid aminotransferase
MARLEATSAGVDEAIMLDLDGYVSEAPGNNVFVVRDGIVLTPPENILEGITRETVFELCARADLPFEVHQLTMFDLHNADEAFLSTTAGGITPIIEVDGLAIGDGKPGPITRRIRSDYWSALERGEHGTPLYHV